MQLSLRDFIDKYYSEYKKFYNEPLIKKINKQVYRTTVMGYRTLNIKNINLNYIWDKHNDTLEISFTVYNKQNKVLYSAYIPIKRKGSSIYIGSALIGNNFGNKIIKIIDNYKYEIFELLLKYYEINRKRYSNILLIDKDNNDYIAMNRAENYLSFIIFKEDREKMRYVEVMNTMAGFLKIGREFGILLDTGDYFIRRGKTHNLSSLIIDKKIENLIGEAANNIHIDMDNLPNTLLENKDNGVKKKGRKKNEKFQRIK